MSLARPKCIVGSRGRSPKRNKGNLPYFPAGKAFTSPTVLEALVIFASRPKRQSSSSFNLSSRGEKHTNSRETIDGRL